MTKILREYDQESWAAVRPNGLLNLPALDLSILACADSNVTPR